MKRSLFFAGLLSAGTAVAQQPASQPSAATVEAHVAAAASAAGKDLGSLMGLCKAAPAARPSQAAIDKGIAAQIARPAPAPGQAFDNLYFVGAAWVSAWVLKTSEGLILIDALNNKAEAVTLIDEGLPKLKLDPSQIRYVIVTHGHGDHYGGAQHLIDKYRARVVMSELDWKMTETRLEFSSANWDLPPKRDIAIKDGDKVTLGDTSVLLALTPGHTLGTISPVFDVKSNDVTHRVMLWGGTAFNFGNDIPRMDAYIGATRRMAKMALELKIDVLISNHPAYDQTERKLETLRRQASGDNPFVIGTDAVVRSLKVMEECALAQRDRFLLKP